jgi:hypothetical protein
VGVSDTQAVFNVPSSNALGKDHMDVMYVKRGQLDVDSIGRIISILGMAFQPRGF